ncbi:MAG: hypothetical protein AAF533_03615 [Acidobacteriota bacterium]
MDLELHLDAADASHRPGGTINGRVEVPSRELDGLTAPTLRIQLGWRALAVGRALTSEPIVETVPLSTDGRRAEQAFAITVPDGPTTLDRDDLRIDWILAVQVQAGGASVGASTTEVTVKSGSLPTLNELFPEATAGVRLDSLGRLPTTGVVTRDAGARGVFGGVDSVLLFSCANWAFLGFGGLLGLMSVLVLIDGDPGGALATFAFGAVFIGFSRFVLRAFEKAGAFSADGRSAEDEPEATAVDEAVDERPDLSGASSDAAPARRLTTLVCRNCGGPLDGEDLRDGMDCGFCGTREALDDDRRGRLRRHAARVLRADHRVRALLRHHVLDGIVRRFTLPAMAAGYPIALLLTWLATGLVMAGLFFLLSALVGEGIAAVVTFLGGIAGMVATVLVPLKVVRWLRSRARVKASTLARACALQATTTETVSCTQCGGSSSLVVVADAPAMSCPWCDAQLVPERRDLVEAAMQGVLAEHESTGDRALRHARAIETACRGSVDDLVATVRLGAQVASSALADGGGLPGFERHGGILEGRVDGLETWVSSDLLRRGRALWRVEVPADLELPGTLWLLRPDSADEMLGLADGLGLVAPTETPASSELGTGWLVRADAEVDLGVLTTEEGRNLLARLGPGESLRLDPAGGSAWALVDDAGERPLEAEHVLARAGALARWVSKHEHAA